MDKMSRIFLIFILLSEGFIYSMQQKLPDSLQRLRAINHIRQVIKSAIRGGQVPTPSIVNVPLAVSLLRNVCDHLFFVERNRIFTEMGITKEAIKQCKIQYAVELKTQQIIMGAPNSLAPVWKNKIIACCKERAINQTPTMIGISNEGTVGKANDYTIYLDPNELADYTPLAQYHIMHHELTHLYERHVRLRLVIDKLLGDKKESMLALVHQLYRLQEMRADYIPGLHCPKGYVEFTQKIADNHQPHDYCDCAHPHIEKRLLFAKMLAATASSTPH